MLRLAFYTVQYKTLVKPVPPPAFSIKLTAVAKNSMIYSFPSEVSYGH